jgi:sialate O-acetylesterase
MPFSANPFAAAAFLCALAPTAALAEAGPAPLMASVFQDHAVLQRDRPISVFGRAKPGETVAVALDGKSATATADASGAWRATLPALPAGGPHMLSATSAAGDKQIVSDVVMGDVFLCSGQSNMELPVKRALNSGFEISQGNDANIRLLTVAKATAAAPQADFATPPKWEAASSANVGEFSAACWFFARDLEKTVKAPIGLIHSSWGGSHIETWMGADGLRRSGGLDEPLKALALYARDPVAGEDAYAQVWQAWWTAHFGKASTPWKPETDVRDWRPEPEPMRDWKTWGVPELAKHDGMLWFRREVTLTAAQAAQPADLVLGAIDEVDQTWVNGKPVGASFGWATDRTYPVPPHVLHAGKNVIVVNVLSTWDAAGMYGPREKMALKFKDGGAAPLAGEWIWKFVPETYGYPPGPPWGAIVGLTTTYDAMIAPLGAYGLKGVLWYQGESNTGATGVYKAQLAGMMADWRAQFGQADLPFLIVQLPNFGAAPTHPAASDWANLREAQRLAVAADPHAALAVTIDAGMNGELHPPNKQAVGQRLARAARSLIYGEKISPSGPEPVSAKRDGAQVRVAFKGAEGGLVSWSGPPNAFELCGADQASCRWVEARLDGDGVVLTAPQGFAPTRVRYCWGDGPVCTLYEGKGLPAGPFEMAITPGG